MKLADGPHKKISIEEIKGFESDNVSKYASDESFKRLVGLEYF